MSALPKVFIVALLCVSMFAPLASAGSVAPEPIDSLEDAQLQQLEAQTMQEIENIQGGLSETWAIVGVVLVVLLVAGAVV